MSYWSGALMLLAAAWLVRDAIARRASVRAAAAAAIARGETIPPGHRNMTALAEIVPPMVYIALFVIAAQIVFAWWTTDAGDWFSGFDIAAFLALLVAYGFWLSLKTRYRPGWRPA